MKVNIAVSFTIGEGTLETFRSRDCSSDYRDKAATIPPALQQQIEAVFAEELPVDDVTVNSTGQHSDWEFGDCCPECGETRLNIVEPRANIYHSGDGDFEFVDIGNGGADGTVSVLCTECLTELYWVPLTTFT